MAKGSQKAAAAAPALKPQGTKHKRTPQSFADGAAGKDVYEPAKDDTLEHSLFAAFNTD